jgi:hypothetical protein
MWYAPLGFLVTILVAQVVSRIVNAYQQSRSTSSKKINEELLSPMFPQCFRTARHLPDPILLVKKQTKILQFYSNFTKFCVLILVDTSE